VTFRYWPVGLSAALAALAGGLVIMAIGISAALLMSPREAGPLEI
jgi:uncharacterized integral membrane protein